MDTKKLLSYTGSAVATIFTGIQTDEIFSIISLVITILSVVLSITISVVDLVQKVKKNGKINTEDVEQLKNDLQKSLDDLNNSKGDN